MRRGAAFAIALCVACESTRPAAPPVAPHPASATAQVPLEPPGKRWPELAKQAGQARKAHDENGVRDALLAMRALAPNDLDVDYALAECEAARGDADAAARWLEAYAAAGLTIDLAKAEGPLAKLVQDPRFDAARARLAANARPVARATVAFALPRGDLLVEDVAWDEAARTFYVTSVRGRKVLAIDARGAARDLTAPEREGLGVMGVALDRARSTLWLVEAPLPQVPGFAKGADASTPSAVVAVDPASGKVKERIELPPDGARHALTDVALAPNGDVLASDARAGVVYVLRQGAHALAPLASGLRSPQTPAVRKDGRAYVPDYALGIAIVDGATGATSWLAAPPDVDLHGIDGLYLAGDAALVALQNGTTPPRVIRFRLSADGARVASSEVLEAGTPGLGEPTHGALVGNELWFIASSGWSRFDDDGQLVKDPPPDAPAMWRVRTD